MDVFNQLNYKDFIRDSLREKKRRVSASFTYDRMAKACGIQKTYLSRVLNSDDAHLSEEQLFLAARYLGLSGDERFYLQLLRAHQKASTDAYKQELRAQIDTIRSANDRSERHLLAEKTVPTSDLSPYYLDPNVMLVHIFLAVARFKKDIRAMARQLNLSEEYVSDILTKLEQMKLIQLADDGYALLKDSTHLPIDSPLYYPYRFMQRVKSLDRIQKLPREKTYNFSVVFSADEDARKAIKAKFLEFLEHIETLATSASDQEVYQINFDLFDWST